MYYDTLQEAVDTVPDCTHVLTTGPEWIGVKRLIGKFIPATLCDKKFVSHVGSEPEMSNQSWIVAWTRGDGMSRTEAAYKVLGSNSVFDRCRESRIWGYSGHQFTNDEMIKYEELVNDGYTLWLDGGECPADEGVRVDVVTREYGKFSSETAGYLRWSHKSESDIIAYRVVEDVKFDGFREVSGGSLNPVLQTKINICSEREDVPECSKVADMVNNPPHYQILPGVEVYDIRCALMDKIQGATHAQVSDWDRAVEYLLRMWDKNGIQDAKKALGTAGFAVQGRSRSRCRLPRSGSRSNRWRSDGSARSG